ncbi:hypothetical protein MLD38_018597 [Melastoma candidum]|uniref:Uncharacterized protein n=1 Tax=Melastoma candidum TaxID=119954 RepID=A0ACB9QTR3_9MYRT|nr:hypothetical protein MLD38_018597 [Melastoma candidum]
MDNQIHELKSCEPEFLVCTPGRLLEPISVKAIDISGMSLLVVDGIGDESGYLDQFKSVSHRISDNPCMVVFTESHSDNSCCTSSCGSPSPRNKEKAWLW